MKLNPYIRIMRAAKAGRGVVLTADECRYLSLDDAIETTAANTEGDQSVDTGSYIITRQGFVEKNQDHD